MNFPAPPSCMEGGFFYPNLENLHYFYSRLLALYTKQDTKMHKIRIIRISIFKQFAYKYLCKNLNQEKFHAHI